ncbi:membrane protein [Bacteroidales bacterium]|nr:membrane protein [Bacteroidales bacterium]
MDSFLDKSPYGSLNEQNFPNTEAEVFQVLTACYSWYAQEAPELDVNLFEFGDVASDDSYKGGESDNDRPFSNDVAYFRAVSNNQLVENFWLRSYEGIYRCNQVIARIPQITFSDEDLKKRYIAEARFLRSYFYFNLVRVYGAIPLIDRPVVYPKDDVIFPRSPESEIHLFLRKELNELALDLPQKNQIDINRDWGRTTQHGALAYLARVELYFGKFQQAKEAAWNVINSGQYGLEPQFGDLFFKPKYISEESVLEVLNTDTDGKGDASIIPTYCRSRGCGGWGFNCPTQDLVNEFEDGDPRILYTITETDDLFLRRDGTPEKQNHTGYASGDGYHSRKVFLPETRRSSRSEMEINFKIVRYADVLLMYAEAVLEGDNNLSEACKYINLVRDRARSTYKFDAEAFGTTAEEKTASRMRKVSDASLTVLQANNTQQVRDALRKERRVELAMENLRFYDLKRWGADYAKQRIETAKGFVIPGNYQQKLSAFPIPQRDIDRSGGAITQNEGW